MKCPYCGDNRIQVKDSRPTEDSYGVKRRRFCVKCHAKFITIETLQLQELMVVKKNGRRKPFDKDKIIRAMHMALRKRDIEPEKVEQIANEIVLLIEKRGEREIATKVIGELIMKKLEELDQVAYVRFASVYCDFKDAKDFQKFIKETIKE